MSKETIDFLISVGDHMELLYASLNALIHADAQVTERLRKKAEPDTLLAALLDDPPNDSQDSDAAYVQLVLSAATIARDAMHQFSLPDADGETDTGWLALHGIMSHLVNYIELAASEEIDDDGDENPSLPLFQDPDNTDSPLFQDPDNTDSSDTEH